MVFFTPLGERPLAAFFEVGKMPVIDFPTLELTNKPNQYLLCPKNYCKVEPHAKGPQFDLSVQELRIAWMEMVSIQPRTTLFSKTRSADQLDYIQRTKLVRFPDIITVRFIEISQEQSTIAVYSRSIYGRSDFGANKTRIDHWIAELNRLL